MASVRLKAGSAHWFACFALPTGRLGANGRPIMRRVQRSTGTADKSRALQMAITFERAAIAASEKRWNEQAAQRFVAELSALASVQVAHVEPIDAFLRRWLAGRKSGLSAGSVARYDGVIGDFVEWLGDRAGAPLSDVTPAVVARFRDAETAAGKSPATVNKALMILGQAFAEAVTLGAFDHNPARGLNVRGQKRTAQKRRAFTFEQFRELVRVTAADYVPPERTTWKAHTLEPDWQRLILVLGYTGARQQEAAQLRWEQVDIPGRRVTLERTKTGDEHWIPLHPALAAHLAEVPEAERRGPVFPHLSTLQRRRISNKFRTAILPRIGIVQAYSEDEGRGEGRRLAEYSLHSLRHSLSTWLAAAGVEESMRMQLIGHEDEGVNRGYTHTEFSQAAEALAKVPAV